MTRPLEELGLQAEPPGHVPTHGRPFPLRLVRKTRKRRAMRALGYDKVFVIGSSRTGTSSMGVALMQLGFTYTGWHPRLVDAWRRGDVDAIFAVADRYEAFKDPPWNVSDVYRLLDARYPNSKFINTIREPESWVASFQRHFGKGDEAALLEDYHRRNAEIRAYFAGRERDFLEIDVVGGGGGWLELTRFLGFPQRLAPFPNADAQAALKSP